MKFKAVFIYCFILILLQACSSKADKFGTGDEQALISFNGKVLYQQEVENAVPKGLNQTDSTLAAEAYIKMWIKNELVYEKAEENLNDKERINDLVNNYRQTLTIYTYQEQLLTERLSKEISEDELISYYNQHPDQFELTTNIIKGLFLKVPLVSPQLENLRKWYKSATDKAIENIEKYSLQNAVIYDYFYDKWVDFDEVMDNIPYSISDNRQFLRNNKSIEIQDSTYIYLLNIKEYVLSGGQAPFEYIKGQVFDILVSQKREKFIREFEDDLYNAAIKNNRVKFYYK